MKNKIFASLLALTLALSLTACGGAPLQGEPLSLILPPAYPLCAASALP